MKTKLHVKTQSRNENQPDEGFMPRPPNPAFGTKLHVKTQSRNENQPDERFMPRPPNPA